MAKATKPKLTFTANTIHTPRDYPTTKEEWWQMCEYYWDDFLAIMSRYLPMDSHGELDKYGRGMSETPLLEQILKAKQDRDPVMWKAFQATWDAAPDCLSIYNNPAWGHLCDLCSEQHCLNEEEE